MTLPAWFTPVPGVYYGDCLFPNRDSSTALCCLWTVPSKVKNPERYYMIGPCVSQAGVDHVVRTLLANPTLRLLVVGGPDLSGTRALLLSALWRGDDPADKEVGRATDGLVREFDGVGDPRFDSPPTHPEQDHYLLKSERLAVVLPLPPPDQGASPTGRGWPGQRTVPLRTAADRRAASGLEAA